MYAVDTNNPAYKHGHAGSTKFSPTYQSWATMIQRCTNRHVKAYNYYGGRGIRVCGEWLVFSRFLADMGERPPGLTLDRIDVDGDYTKDNCRWANVRQQANNKRSNVLVEIGGVVKSVTEWCEELGWSKNTVWARINKHGFTPYEALTKPKQDAMAFSAAGVRRRAEIKLAKSGKQG